MTTSGAEWRGFAAGYVKVFFGVIAGIYLFVLLVDPYHVVPFSLPLDRKIMSISQRHMYPQIVRSKRFDSLLVGTSTSRLLDPELLDAQFGARFANLSMDSATAWEQHMLIDLFLRTVGPPKVLMVGLDVVWCDAKADRNRITFRGFPDWLYDDNPWNDYLYLFNYPTIEIAGRMVGYQLGLQKERVRFDGYNVFVPPEAEYDPVKVHQAIWRGREPASVPDGLPLPPLPPERRSFPALAWLDEALTRLPSSSMAIFVFMPVHIAAQPTPGSEAVAVEAECKVQVADMARKHGAKVIDWRIASPLTRDEANYWDNLHYRVPIATDIVKQLGPAALTGRESEAGNYRILAR